MARGGFFAVDSLTSMHVLVVDDDPSFRDMLVALLRYCGALVTAVTTPEQAWLAIEQVRPDALVITVGGREVSSASLPEKVRARKPEDGGNVPIVAVVRGTAIGAPPEGVNAHLPEPLDPWELCRVLSTLRSLG